MNRHWWPGVRYSPGLHPDRVGGYWLRLHRPYFDFENVQGVGLDVFSCRAPGQSEPDWEEKPQAEAASVGEIQ